MAALPILELGDDPFERGLVHGRDLAPMIAENIDTYLAHFAAGGLDSAEARREGQAWVEVIANQNGDYSEEMRGVAEGASLPLGDIAMLNARYEITFGLFGKEARANDLAAIVPDIAGDADGCSSFGALPEATVDGHTVIGQNWDWLAGVHGRCAVLRIRRKSGTDLICYTEAGIVGGKMGVNEHGIGLVENGLVSDHDGQNAYEKPFHVRCREILDAETYDMALHPIVATRRVCSANFVVGHADGEVIDLETSPNAVSYHYPSDGLITHSNHFLDPRHGPSQMERLSTSTLYRANRLDRLLRKDIGKLDASACQKALTDHFGYPNAICRHPDDRLPVAKRTMTNAAFVIDLNTRTMLIANGPPCSNAFVAHALEPEEMTRAAE
ncbi:MAG: C45 family autoproteolytic acyltransferase/hydrolase [Alphaproteobacteria bacterium]|nr:C45 family autoproteolytic acyltransferase/hydrolase [Alphaproteobacteria bacterium]MCZ6844693.1 C45 family autoproteolytic acyltransferase/hydrolase [Alphaproteobacteria bacterium]